MWKMRRDPLAGYNCFGHVFALRRTALYCPDVELILAEDGFGEIKDPEPVLVGDVVIYSDDSGPTHAAKVDRVDTLVSAQASQGTGVPIVLSKFDDVSGEYEHPIEDSRWHHTSVSVAVYRERKLPPRRKPGWRTAVSSLVP
jgi:hypothetical protein